MAIQWKERPGSRQITSGENPTRRDKFSLAGTADESIVYILAAQFTSPIVSAAGQIVNRQEISLDHQGHDLWYVDVSYGKKKAENGSYTFSFSTTAGTIQVRQAKEHIATYPAGGPDMNGAIDVAENGEVRGAAVMIPATKFTYTFKHPLGVVSEPFAIALGDLVGKTNSSAWHGMPAGSALFIGHNGSGGTEQDTSVQYEVAYSKGLVNATIAGVTGVNKKGWEVAWEFRRDAEDGGNPAKELRWIYIDRVYDSFDFYAGFGF